MQSQMNPVCALAFYFFRIKLTTILTSTTLKWPFSLRSSTNTVFACLCLSLSPLHAIFLTNLILCAILFLYCNLCIFIGRGYVFLLLSMYSYRCPCILIVSLCILIVVYVFLLLVYVFFFLVYLFLSLSMHSYCCLCIHTVVYAFLDAATLTEVLLCFFLSCKANARV